MKFSVGFGIGIRYQESSKNGAWDDGERQPDNILSFDDGSPMLWGDGDYVLHGETTPANAAFERDIQARSTEPRRTH